MGLSKQSKETAINLISNIISLCFSIGIGFFLSPYIVRHLGTEANGYTGLANNFVTYATLLTTALNSMAARFIAIEYHKGNMEEARKYYSSVMLGNIAIIAIFILPAVLMVANLHNLINITPEHLRDVKILFAFVFANFLVSLITSVLFASTYVTNKLYYQNVYNVASSVLNALLLLGLFGFFEPKMYYVSLVGLILSIGRLAVAAVVKKRIMDDIKFDGKKFSIRYIVKLVSSGIWNTINQCGNILMTGLDLLLTNLFINPYEMGILSIAKTIPNYIIQLGAMVNNNFSPSLTITYATSEKEDIVRNLRSAMKISSIMMSIPIMVFISFGESFYSLWMPTVDSSKVVILSFLTCMSFIPFAGSQVLYNVYTTMNKLKVNSIVIIITGAINVIVVYILLKFTDLGTFAVAGVSSVITIVRNLVVTVPYTAKLLKLKWYTFYKDVLISCLCGLAVFVISRFVKIFIVGNTWITLIFAVGISVILGFVVEIVILLNKEERTVLINKLIKRNIKVK